MTRAIIYVPPVGYEESAARCLDHVQACGYDFKGLVQDWSAVERMMAAGEVSVVVIDKDDDLDPKRKPRIEVVSHYAGQARRFEQRTRIIRRNAAR